MMNYFYMGGALFMGTLTLILLSMIVLGAMNAIKLFNGSLTGQEAVTRLSYIKAVGLFALVVGVLGQLIGLFDAFAAIERMGSVSPEMLAGGLKVSSITTIYGLIIFVVSYLVWFGLSLKLNPH